MNDRPTVAPEGRYAELVAAFVGEPDVDHAADGGPTARRFGASALKVRGKIFAMLYRDRLAVKLPRQRVDALIAAGAGERFDSGQGRPMKEWLAVAPSRRRPRRTGCPWCGKR